MSPNLLLDHMITTFISLVSLEVLIVLMGNLRDITLLLLTWIGPKMVDSFNPTVVPISCFSLTFKIYHRSKVEPLN